MLQYAFPSEDTDKSVQEHPIQILYAKFHQKRIQFREYNNYYLKSNYKQFQDFS